jgi:hypothetical protein
MFTSRKERFKHRRDKLRNFSVEEFRDIYFTQRKTMKAIAEMLRVSRPALYKWFARNKSYFSESLQRRSGTGAGYTLNRNFFNEWTPEMAYVLGVLATDGCVSKNRFSLTSTDLELVEKVRNLLVSDHPIGVVHPKGWARKTQYILNVSSTELAKRLTDLGIGPAKSLTLRFPGMPQDCVRHFLRGCWDGDGSFYFESRPRGNTETRNQILMNFRASLVSGSKRFVEGIIEKIHDAGIKPQRPLKPLAVGIRRGVQRFKYFRTIRMYETRRGRSVSYSLRLVGANAISLARLLYDGVPESMYLKRKYEIFCKTAQTGETLSRKDGPIRIGNS